MKKIEVLSLTHEEMSNFLPDLPKYRTDQIFEWLHRRNAATFEKMENLPKTLRYELSEMFFIPKISVEEQWFNQNDKTEKYLNKINNDVFVESVLMRYKHGNTICISTQAGCRMGCKFCATAESGFHRNLTAGEYLMQVYHNPDIKNIVLMGCGEPLDNLAATLRFVELITHPKGKNISQRNITISTCGLVPQIYELAEHKLQITLAISLHAPTDEIRETIMPIAKTHPLPELIQACRHYADKTNRRLTFEYALIHGLNDSVQHAKLLAKLLKGLLCHINLIPINKARSGFSHTPRRETEKFAAILQEKNTPVTIRRSLGGDINAACGQLRARQILRNN
ncbi:MAG: 23S rRNA (adenine(2503)-C(2))-methyltransferase RlmN [Defluviitaleaceae bacterium]|nr:23S rRNA (adenine(2503)-C(2))-methyltransferase RlmN [Defluviitaleaceae bacterium]